MNNLKHISGPWNYKRQGFQISIGNEDTGATKHGHNYTVCKIDDNSMQAEANAQLIAAAPDLLELLQWAINEIESTPDELSDALLGLIKLKAQKAIEKATQI